MEQRGRRPIFIATLWAAASWLFFRPAAAGLAPHVPHQFRDGGMNTVSGNAKLVRDARRSRLEKQPTDPAAAGRKSCLFRGQDNSFRPRGEKEEAVRRIAARRPPVGEEEEGHKKRGCKQLDLA